MVAWSRRGLSGPVVAIVVVAVLAVAAVILFGGAPSRPGSGGPPSSSGSAPSSGSTTPSGTPVAAQPPPCDGPGRTVTRPEVKGAVLQQQWDQASTPDGVTYDLTGVTSTAYPSTRSIFAVGSAKAGRRTCVVGGTIHGRADAAGTWNLYHDSFNAACVKIIAVDWMQVRGLRCDNVEDGIRPEESAVNANNTRFYVSGTYLSHIRDDCMENDYTVGGLLQDNLWEQCNTGLSERPSGGKSWTTPPSETVTLDHMLIGLYQTPHDKNGATVQGENALFKWSASGNHVVIKCSLFKVDALSLNGKDAMGLPPGTVIDDSACPAHPTTLVWLGGGTYPGNVGAMKVVTDVSVWNTAVQAWKTAHGY